MWLESVHSTHRAKKAGQFVGNQKKWERVCPWRLGKTEVLPGPPADVAELVVTESLTAGDYGPVCQPGRVPDMAVSGGKLLYIRSVYVLKSRSAPPPYNPPPQRYCQKIPSALKSLPVRVETPVLP
jgi:hypothetical protein